MSPKIKEENYTSIHSERLRELAKKQGITITHLAEKILCTSYRNFSRILAKGIIRKDDLEKLCDALDVSRQYLNGSCSSFRYRIEDYYSEDEIRNSLKNILKFYQMPHYMESIDKLTNIDINNLVDILVALIDSPEQFYKIVSMDNIQSVHEQKILDN